MGQNLLKGLLAALLATTLALFVMACDETGEGDDGGPSGDGPITQPDSGPPPEGIEFKKANESAELNFESGSEEFLVVPYSVSETASSGIAFEIKVAAAAGGSDGGQTFPLKLPPRLPLSVRDPMLWAKWQQRLSVERWTRKLMVKAAKMTYRPPMNNSIAACTLSSECADTEVCHAGNCAANVTVKVDSFSATATIDAAVKKKGTVAAILVDSADTVDQATVDGMLAKFEDVIYKRDVALFGNPKLKDTGEQLSSDRNGDGLVWLVLTSKVQEKNAVGFFVATDFENATDEPKSNEADILYLDSAQELKKTYGLMAHEFQHLLGFGAKVYKPKANGGQGALEALWLDEGQAHFAEDACGFGGENVAMLDQEVFTSFSETAMFENANDSLAMRGMAFTYVRYIFEQAGGVSYGGDGTITDNGGAAMLAKIHTSDKQGAAAVAAAYGDPKQAFDGWVAAISLDGRGVTTDSRYIFQALVDDPVTSEKVGVKIRGQRMDDTGSTVDLQGPLQEDLTADVSDSIPNATAKFFLLKGKSGKVSVTVETQEQDFRFAVFKLK